jgi:hypothetical protein
VATDGSFAELGYFTTSATGPVWMTNNRTQLLICDGVTAHIYTLATGGFAEVSDADWPGASTADYQDGYGIFTQPSSNIWFFSGLNDFNAIDSLDFYAKSRKPDNVLAIKSINREPWVYGEKSTEVWYNAGGDNSSAANATFAPNTGGLIDHGLGAVASPLEFDNTAIWLSDKGQILQAQGYIAKSIGNDMIGRAIAGYSTFSDAIAFSYTDHDHTFYQLTFPTGGETWVYDAKTQIWFKKTSYLNDGSGYGRHRANCYAILGNKHYVGDYNNGKIYEMSMDYYDDNGEEIERILYSQEIDSGIKRSYWPDVQLIVEAGQGGISLDPQISLEYSNDSGYTWSSELWRGAGLTGEYGRRAIWRQMGSSFKRMYRFTMTDSVLWRILSIDYGGK